MTYRLGIIPAAGKAVRFGGVLKELLPLPSGVSFLGEAVLRLKAARCNDIVIITSEEKIQQHADRVGDFVFYAIQNDNRDIYGAIATAIHFEANEYLFTMPDTYMNRDAFKDYDGFRFALGCHFTFEPERFGCFKNGVVVNKDKSIPTPATGWGVLAWTKEVVELWRAFTPADYTSAINMAMEKFGYKTWMLDFYHDNASIDDYVRLMRKEL